MIRNPAICKNNCEVLWRFREVFLKKNGLPHVVSWHSEIEMPVLNVVNGYSEKEMPVSNVNNEHSEMEMPVANIYNSAP
jgi:hypothetical protein